VKILTPSIWNIKVNFFSTKGFDISMAMPFIHPSHRWFTSMSFSGGGTSLPHQANSDTP
jgi:hypothetical protein